MPKLSEIYARKKEASAQVSTQTRSLALGFLAIAWALLTVHDEPLKTMAANVDRNLLLALAASSVLVILCDLLQYVFATRMAEEAARVAEDSPKKYAMYESESFAYRAQAFLYYAKFWILAAGSLLLLAVFVLLFLPPHAAH